MTKAVGAAAALLLFTLVATANSGGYRYGVSDQAFYAPAVAMRADPVLFPRDRSLLEPQMRLWAGDEWLGALSRVLGADLPPLFAALYVVTLLMLAGAAVVVGRSIGCSWWTIAVFLILLTLRHRIAKTGANSLEGYFHPRMLAFAIGLFALAAVARGRTIVSGAWVVLSALIHTTTAVWFGAVVAVAAVWARARTRRSSPKVWIGMAAAAGAAVLAGLVVVPQGFVAMDDAWLAVLGEKDYLFPAEWPMYAWVSNLAYPVLLVAIYRARVRRQVASSGEAPLLVGLLALVAIFLVSVPFTELRWALAVQLQVNRIFWLLDTTAVLYLAWWLIDASNRTMAVRGAVVAGLLVLAVGRGFYVVRLEADRPLVQLDLAATDWTDAMRWLRTQPSSWHVLADPGHAWLFGSSVRVAARRDTLLETGKDTAVAMYDRAVAARVAERLGATGNYGEMSRDDIAALDARFALDVMVDRADRTFELPVLYRNESFVVYDLR